MDNDNKSSPQMQDVNDMSTKKIIDTPLTPRPRTYEGKEYYGAADVAKIIGVGRTTVLFWEQQGLFLADARAHDGRYLYEVERVMQLKAVYHPNWTRGGYEPTPVDEKQSQIATAGNFFNQLYGKITAPHFAYLWTKQRGIFSFNISDETQRSAMAIKAVELSDNGVDVWHSINPVCVQPTDGKRGDETVVSYQIACVVDIDISSNAHKSDNLATSFEEAKSFLPFTPSIFLPLARRRIISSKRLLRRLSCSRFSSVIAIGVSKI